LGEEDAGLSPGTLLIPPVRELGGWQKRVGTFLRVAQHFDRTFGILQSFFRALMSHGRSEPPFTHKATFPYAAESTSDLRPTQGDGLDLPLREVGSRNGVFG
jgi:hypothetical protein